MNFGGFAGGFSQGFGQGVSLGKTIGDVMKQKKVEEVRAQGVEEAKAAREKEVSGMVKETGIGPAPTTKPAPTDVAKPGPAAAAPIETSMLPAPAAVVTTTPVSEPVTTVTQPGIPPAASATPAAPPTATTPSSPQVSATPQNAAPVPEPVPGPVIQPAPAIATPAAAGGITPAAPAMPFMVGDKGFKTREEAVAHASKAAPPLSEFTGRALAGRMEQHYLESGDIETAEKWGAWAKTKKNERNMETWAEAYKLAQNGDHAGSARQLMKLYPDYNDGMTLTKTEAVTDAQGREVGFKMTVRDKEGKERVVEHDAQTISRMGLQQMTPQKMFEMDRKEQTDAAAARAKAAADAANDRRTLQREIVVEGVKARTRAGEATIANERDIEKLGIKQQLDDAGLSARERAKVDTKVDYLKRSGYSEAQIAGLMPAIVGAGEHKKVTDPTERRAIIATELAKDPVFARKPLADKNKAVDEMMDVIHGPSGQAVAPSNVPPAAGGIGKPPAAAAPKAAPKAPGDKGKGNGTPFLTPEGKVVYL